MRSLFVLLSLLSTAALAGSPVIFDQGRTRTLTDNVSLNAKIYWLQGTANPTVTAQNAPAGSYYMKTSAAVGLYVKTDAGSSTNWTLIGAAGSTVTGPGSSTDNAIVRWDGTGGGTLQDSAATVSDAGLLSTANVTVTAFGAGIVHSSGGGVLSSSAVDVSSTDITGVLKAAAEPAHTGDVTNTAGALATTVSKIQGTTVSGTTGTGNVMFSASPTSTGTLTAGTVAATTLTGAGSGITALNGSNISSGTVGLARGGTNSDLSATGGASQVLKQASVGGAVSVAQLACADLSNSVASCSTDTTSATNISSGTLAVARGGTGIGSGTSGGVLGFTAAGTIASSGELTASQLVLGGGAGVLPSALAAGSQYVPLTMGASNPGYTALALNQAAATSGSLLNSRGGTGGDSSSSTGIAHVSSGTWSYSAVALGGADVSGTLATASGGTSLGSSGSAGNVLSSDGTNWTSTDILASHGVRNIGLSTSISSNTLIINLVQGDGSTNCAASTPCLVATRSATAATGSYSTQSITAAKSITLGATASLGNASQAGDIVYVYWIQDTTSEMCVSHFPFDQGSLWSATATPATSSTVLYCANTHTSRPIRLLGRVTASWSNPNWSAVTEVTVGAFATSNIIPPTTQTFISGSAQTYTTATSPRVPAYLEVFMWGGGGGGGGSGTTNGTAATNGASSAFETSLLTAPNGVAGARGTSVGTGGTAPTVSAPAIDIGSMGGNDGGAGSTNAAITTVGLPGASGGATGCVGGTPSGGGGAATGGGGNAATNSGAGGAGASVNDISSGQSGGGGGGGSCIRAIIPNPAATYTYTVGTAGSGQAAGTSGAAGGNGAAGKIIVIEHYQ